MKQITEQEKQTFAEQGYLIVPHVLDPKQLQQLRANIIKLAAWEREQGEAAVYGHGKHQRIWNLINKGEIFRETIQHPLIIEMMQHLLGDDFILSSWTVNMIGPHGQEEGLHIDSHVPEPIPSFPVKINSIWLIDDFTEHNGATLCLPGSHKSLRHPQPSEQHHPDLIKLIAPAGSVMITHGGLWHKSGSNETDQDRICLLGSFCPGFMRPQEDHLQVLDSEVLDQASPLLKKLVGLDYGIMPGARLKPPLPL